jgi:hypothetical protein
VAHALQVNAFEIELIEQPAQFDTAAEQATHIPEAVLAYVPDGHELTHELPVRYHPEAHDVHVVALLHVAHEDEHAVHVEPLVKVPDGHDETHVYWYK